MKCTRCGCESKDRRRKKLICKDCELNIFSEIMNNTLLK